LNGSIVAILNLLASSKVGEEELGHYLRSLFRLSQRHLNFNENLDGLVKALGRKEFSVNDFC
jgi:hypothetical protein